MTAPEREALVKALRDQIWIDVPVKKLLVQAADMIEALAPAAARIPSWVPLAKALFELERDPTIKDQAWFDFQSKAERLTRIMGESATLCQRNNKQDAVIAAVENLIDNSPIDDKDRPYISEVAFREFNALVAAFAALKSTTPQTGSQE